MRTLSTTLWLPEYEQRLGMTKPSPYREKDPYDIKNAYRYDAGAVKARVNKDLYDRMEPQLQSNSNLRNWASDCRVSNRYGENFYVDSPEEKLREKIRSAIDGWASTAGDHHTPAWHLQHAAQKVFGLPASSMRYGAQQLREIHAGASTGEVRYLKEGWHHEEPFYDSFVRAVYANTQDHLRKRYGCSNREIELHGGVRTPYDFLLNSKEKNDFLSYYSAFGPPVDTSEDVGNDRHLFSFKGMDGESRSDAGLGLGEDMSSRHTSVQSNPLSSWSLSTRTAHDFAGTDVKGGLAHNRSFVLSHKVPISRVWSDWESGPGCLREHEKILLGGRHNVSLNGYGWDPMMLPSDMRESMLKVSQRKMDELRG